MIKLLIMMYPLHTPQNRVNGTIMHVTLNSINGVLPN
jgi:hypothetical protein